MTRSNSLEGRIGARTAVAVASVFHGWTLVLSVASLCLFTYETSALNPERLASQYLVDRFGRESGLPSDTVWVVREGPNGYLWIGTRGGLVRFDGARFSVFNRQSHPEFSANEVRDLEWTPNGELWIGTYGGGAMLMRDGEFESIGSEDGLWFNGRLKRLRRTGDARPTHQLGTRFHIDHLALPRSGAGRHSRDHGR